MTWEEASSLSDKELPIIDDFGLQPLDSLSRAILMDIIKDRHGKRSALFSSQGPVYKWYEVIGEQTIADAMLNRIIHYSHRLELKVDSMSKKRISLEINNEEIVNQIFKKNQPG